MEAVLPNRPANSLRLVVGTRKTAFDIPHYLRDVVSRAGHDDCMQVVRHDDEAEDVEPVLRTRLVDDLQEQFRGVGVGEDRPSLVSISGDEEGSVIIAEPQEFSHWRSAPPRLGSG